MMLFLQIGRPEVLTFAQWFALSSVEGEQGGARWLQIRPRMVKFCLDQVQKYSQPGDQNLWAWLARLLLLDNTITPRFVLDNFSVRFQNQYEREFFEDGHKMYSKKQGKLMATIMQLVKGSGDSDDFASLEDAFQLWSKGKE